MKNFWNTIIVAAAVAAMFTAPACQSDDGESTYVVLPLREDEEPTEEAGSELYIPSRIKVHVFSGMEGAGWQPLSYEDAEQGVLSDTTGGGNLTLSPTNTFTQSEEGSVALGSLAGKDRYFLVICDMDSLLYGWRDLSAVGNAGTIYMSVYLRPWKKRNSATSAYTETGWTMVNKLKYKAPATPTEPEEGENENEGEVGEE